MDIAKLKAFIVVAEELNFRRSAEILGMSQPPLTRLIASLEGELGAKLFERTTRQVRLTGAGIVLLREAREITAALERIHNEVADLAKTGRGALRIGFSRTAFLARLPLIMDEFGSRFPKVKIELQEDSTKEILSGIKNGRFDAGFVEAITHAPGLESHSVHEETLGVLLPKRHPLAKKKEIAFNDLRDETIILHHRKEAQEFHDKISKMIQGLERKPKIYIKGASESCPILVATGKGVSLTIAGSQRIVPEETVFVPIQSMFLPVSIFWKSENGKTALTTFLSAVIENQALKKSRTQCLNLA